MNKIHLALWFVITLAWCTIPTYFLFWRDDVLFPRERICLTLDCEIPTVVVEDTEIPMPSQMFCSCLEEASMETSRLYQTILYSDGRKRNQSELRPHTEYPCYKERGVYVTLPSGPKMIFDIFATITYVLTCFICLSYPYMPKASECGKDFPESDSDDEDENQREAIEQRRQKGVTRYQRVPLTEGYCSA